jgi:hypothetical protein
VWVARVEIGKEEKIRGREETDEQEGEDDAPNEDPLADGKGDLDDAIVAALAVDRVGPGRREEVSDGGVDVGTVDGGGDEDGDVEPAVSVVRESRGL